MRVITKALLLVLSCQLASSQIPPEAIVAVPNATNQFAAALIRPSVVATNQDGRFVKIYAGESVSAGPFLLPSIELDGNTAKAVNARHTARFKANLNEEGSVAITLPNGQVICGRPVALSVSDARGNRLWLGEAHDAVGEVVGADQVLYRDAFEGIRADVLFTYALNSFEQDIILRENPGLPAEIDPATAQIEVWTEFQNTAQPKKQLKRVVLRPGNAVEGKPELEAVDEILEFGPMRMITGHAFRIDGIERKNRFTRSPVIKTWIAGRNSSFLVEAVSFPLIEEDLRKLERFQVNAANLTSTTNLALLQNRGRASTSSISSSFRQSDPAELLAVAETPGVLIDYTLVYGTLLNINFGNGHTGSAAISKSSNESDVWNSFKTPGAYSGTMSPLILSDGSPLSGSSQLVLENAPGHWGNSVSHGMMSDYVYSYSGNVVVTLNQIPAGTYDIYMYGVYGHVGQVNSSFQVYVGGAPVGGPQSVTPGPNWADPHPTPPHLNWTMGEHFARVSDISVAAGQQIRIEVLPGYQGNAVVNGIQLVSSGGGYANNTPPSLSPIPTVTTVAGAAVGPLAFTIGDVETPVNALLVGGTSANQALVPDGNIVIGGSGANRTITLTPAAGQTGAAIITVRVTDGGGASATVSFLLTVNPENPSSLTPILASVNPGGFLRNEPYYWVGFRFTVGASPITVRELGRWIVSGNSQSHVLRIHDYNGAVVPNSEVTLNTVGKPVGQFAYAALANPVTLTAGSTYFILCEEGNSDAWHHNGGTPITLHTAAHSPVSAWSYRTQPNTVYLDYANTTYGPINLRFTVGSGSSNPDSDGDGLADAWENQYFGNLDQTGSGDPDADGLTNAVEAELGLNPAVANQLVQNPDDSFHDFISLADLGFTVTSSDNPVAGLSLATDSGGTRVLAWDSIFVENGVHTLQLEKQIDAETELRVVSQLPPTTVDNTVRFPDFYGIAGAALRIEAKSKHLGGTYSMQVFDDFGDMLGTVTGSVAADGWLVHPADGDPEPGFSLSLINELGEEYPGDFLVVAVTTLPPSQGGFGTLASTPTTVIFNKERDWNNATSFLVAYMDYFENSSMSQLQVRTMMQAIVSTAQTHYPIIRGDAQIPFAIYGATDWSNLRGDMGAARARNLYYFGHGGDSLLGRANLPGEQINTDNLLVILGNSTDPAVRRNLHPYRFVFLDGCLTANGSLPEAFGIPKKKMLVKDFINHGLRPRAFLGWDKRVTIRFANAVNLQHVQFVTNFFSKWADPTVSTGPRGLKDAIDAAAKNSAGQVIFQDALDHLEIFGAEDLLFYDDP